MFARIMAVVTAVIVLLTVAFSVLGMVVVRDQQMTARLDSLRQEARDIAWLAAQNDLSSGMILFGYTGDTQRYLQRRAAQVHERYGAYLVVVDRWGRVMDNFSVTLSDNPDFAASLSTMELNDAISRVLAGEEVSLRTMADSGPLFTVGVPFQVNQRVLGAVLIQTPAQRVEGGWEELVPRIVLMAVLAALVSGAVLFFLVRRIMRPLRQLTGAARAMSAGDFTQRVETERMVPEMAEVAGAFNTMAARISENERNRREFVANVSHELRSPITSISGFVQGMEDGTIPPEEHPQYLHLVRTETQRLSKLISDLLALSRLEKDDAAPQWSDFDICEMLRRAVIRRMGDLERKHMDVACDFHADPCPVHADADRIEQVVVNLVDNAIKFTPEGGRITLSTAERDGLCAVTVADNGPGILPEDRPHVFDRFFTADRAHTAGKGTGLGLSICQQILAMHHQSIRLEDTAEGAAFTFTLQRAAENGNRRDSHA